MKTDLASSQTADDSSYKTVKWSGIQSILEEAESNVLIILDCCSSLSTSPEGRGVMECLAASAFEFQSSAIKFSSVLLDELMTLASYSRPFTIAKLYNRILQNMQRRWHVGQALPVTPVHIRSLEEEKFLQNITLSPVGITQQHPTSQQMEMATASTGASTGATINLEAPFPQKRKRGNAPRPVRIYQCTRISNKNFCPAEFSRIGDWVRHEEGHYPQKQWVCQWSGQDGQNPCSRRDHPFNRKDHLRDHLKMVHNEPIIDISSWFQAVESDWKRQCGFCGAMFENWNVRCEHIGTHFQKGERMASWKDPWPGNEKRRDNAGSGDGEDEDDDEGVRAG
jgi:hypothetical protein